MNLFAVTSLILSLACYSLALLIFIFAKQKLHRYWSFFNLAVGTYGLGMFLAGTTINYDLAFLFWRVAYFGVGSISMFFYLVVSELCNLNNQKSRSIVFIHGSLFSILAISTDKMVNSLRFVFDQFYLPVAGFWWNLFFLIWILIVVISFLHLYAHIRKSQGLRAVQGKYFFYGMLLGFLSGASTSITTWGVSIYPAWHVFVSVYAAICTYAIFRYQIMDISIAVTRAGVFIFVYSLVLGIPFAIAFGWQKQLIGIFEQNWWIVPLVASTVLATGGPYIYGYIQRRAEDRLLQEQRKYQATLRQASLGMGRVKDLKRLLNLIVHIVARSVRIDYCAVFLYHEDSYNFILKATKNKKFNDSDSILNMDSPIIKYLVKVKEPVVYEEIKQQAQDYRDINLKKLEESMQNLKVELMVPSFIENKMIAIIMLGRKKSGKLFTQDDMVVFSILANQSALAIENAEFYENMKRTHEQLFKAEKMATIGTMADGLSHQLNNRLHAMGFIAGDALDSIKQSLKKNISKESKEVMAEVEYALDRIQENVKRGGEIVEGLLKYTRKGEQGFEAVDIEKLVKSAVEMAQFKIKVNEMDIKRNFNGTPPLHGNFTQLQEVFFNLIDNAYDAMMQRKTELKEEGFRPTLTITAAQKGKNIEVLFNDNGIGVKNEDKRKLFTPFFTTKLSSKKGTGLGLYVIRNIIEENHNGKVIFTSEYKRGSQTRLLIPADEGEMS